MSNNISERAATVIPGGVNSGQRRVPGLESLVVTRTSGATFSDATGRTYIDFHAAFGPPLLGHNDPDVDAAVTQAIRQADLMGVGVTEGEVQLAEQLVELLPSVEKVLLTSTGSEATFHALRVSHAATGRRLVIKFQGCYHGWHDSVSMNVISAPDRVGQLDPISQGILPEVLNATLVRPSTTVRPCVPHSPSMARTSQPSSSNQCRTTSDASYPSRSSCRLCATRRPRRSPFSSSTK
jgi:glutamate-1-semialdehyde 2,1-aminomutase